MELTSGVVRCSYCAAPLVRALTDVVVRCTFCDTENFIQATAQGKAHAEQLTLAAAQLRVRSSGAQARADQLHAQMQVQLSEGKKAEALHSFEAYLRVTYAPTLQFIHAPGMPNAEEMVTQIDATIEKALATFAAAHKINRSA